MHSSRMRTVRCSGHRPGGVSAWPGAGGCYENITFPQLLLQTVTIHLVATYQIWI